MVLFIVSYLAGMLTIISPCILPILPFVFSRADQSGWRPTAAMLAGMVISFAAVSTLVAVGGAWVVQANEIGRYVALGFLAFFGLTLVSSRLAASLARPFVGLGDRLSSQAAGSSLLLGVATGLLWTPCAGPILGLVLTGAALQGANLQSTLYLAAYAAGAATSMGLVVLGGRRIIAVLKRHLGIGDSIRQTLGIAVLAGVAVVVLGLDTGLLPRISYASTASLEQSLLDRFQNGGAGEKTMVASNGMMVATNEAYRSELPVEGVLPSLGGATQWLNSEPLTNEQLRGKVVLVDFWTYSCINCIRTLPYVRAWAEKYKDQGLIVIGVHAPEFAFEKNIGNVERAIRNFGITYPVAIDNDFRIWRAFRNSYWPAFYFVDAEGKVRHHQFGEGDYEKAEEVIQDLLADAGSRKAASDLIVPDAKGAEVASAPVRPRSGETYLGYDKASGFIAGERLMADQAADYTVRPPRLNQWSLGGNWTIGAEQASLNRADGSISYRFNARDLHLVLGANGKPVRFQVLVDGKAPGADHGSDTDPEGFGTVSDTKLYQLVRQAGEVRERTFEIRFLDAGVEAYVFTFG